MAKAQYRVLQSYQPDDEESLVLEKETYLYYIIPKRLVNGDMEKTQLLAKKGGSYSHCELCKETNGNLLNGKECGAQFVALFNFIPQQSDELAFNKGDVIVMTKPKELPDEWRHGYNTTTYMSGLFPITYCVSSESAAALRA